MIIKLVVRVLVVVKMCDIGNSDGYYYILSSLKLMILVMG